MADSSHVDDAPPLTNAEFFSPAYLEKRRQAMEQAGGPRDLDELDPKGPSGHAYAFRKSTWITSNIKQTRRKASMNILPQEVIDVIKEAGIENWVLMGLHGYLGYMPEPRATQDVDIMVPYSATSRAKKAITTKWPQLVVRESSPVTRFLDPLDLDFEGQPKPTVDIMHPWSPYQELILEEYVLVDEETQHRIPALEAALVSKYAAMISPHRERDRKEQDAVDFRKLARANHDRIRTDDLRRLAALVWESGADDIERFIQIALSDEPLPI